MNDRERELWVMNDEGLYNWFMGSRLSITKFLRKNREEIDQVITKALNQEPKS